MSTMTIGTGPSDTVAMSVESTMPTSSLPSADSVLRTPQIFQLTEEQPSTTEEVGEEGDPPVHEPLEDRPPQDRAPAAAAAAAALAPQRPWWCDLVQGVGFIAAGLVAGCCYLYFQSNNAPNESLVVRVESLICAIFAVILIGCAGARLIRFSPLADDSRGSRRRAQAAARQREAARRRRKIAKFPLRVVAKRGDRTLEDLEAREVDSGSFVSEGGEVMGGDAQKACPVCLEDFAKGDERRTLPCFHGFHRKCVDQWLMSHDVCPVCRHNVFDTDLTNNEEQ